MTDGWLTPEEHRAWRGFIGLHKELVARLNRQLQEDSLLSLADYEVLVVLSEQPDGRLRPYELAEGLQWEQSRLSHHLARMGKRGLVMREECSADGRGSFVVLTPGGRKAIEAAAPAHVAMVRKLFFDGLSPEQVAALEGIANAGRAQLSGTRVELCDETGREGEGSPESDCPGG